MTLQRVRPLTNYWCRERGFLNSTIHTLGYEVTLPEGMRQYPGSPDVFTLTVDAHNTLADEDSISAYSVVKKLYGKHRGNMHEYASDRAMFTSPFQGRAVITFSTVAEATLFKLKFC